MVSYGLLVRIVSSAPPHVRHSDQREESPREPPVTAQRVSAFVVKRAPPRVASASRGDSSGFATQNDGGMECAAQVTTRASHHTRTSMWSLLSTNSCPVRSMVAKRE